MKILPYYLIPLNAFDAFKKYNALYSMGFFCINNCVITLCRYI